MKKKSSVPIQKGKIDPDPVTMAMETFSQKVGETNAQSQLRRGGQMPMLKKPKKAK